MRPPRFLLCACACAIVWACRAAESPAVVDAAALQLGVASHAFDHLGNIGDQGPAATAAGANIIYGTGFGAAYTGLGSPDEIAALHDKTSAYLKQSRSSGVRLAFGYMCATSIVKLATFDRNWTPDYRANFTTAPADWLQRNREGKPLPSWYGGDYAPACMNHPDWRTHQKHVLRLQLEAGFDGVFFDNPTVHPDGCFCDHCMTRFAATMTGVDTGLPADAPPSAWREIAATQVEPFRRFRASIAADFLREMRAFARTVKPGALVTCNNSLNSPGVLFAQCRTYGYDIHSLSAVEDLVVVEDMGAQPRVLPDGKTVEYGPVYETVHAVARGKPVVAVTIADGDYHTPPRLTRLAMAEAAAHGASYLMWPTWPAEQRDRMTTTIRPQADLLRTNAALLKDARPRADVIVFLPYRRWLAENECWAMNMARLLGAANVQFQVVSEDNLIDALNDRSEGVLLAETARVLTEAERNAADQFKARGGRFVWADAGDWFNRVRGESIPSLKLKAPSTLRAVVRDQADRTNVHLLNLNVRRINSFEDQLTPAEHVAIEVRLPPGREVHTVRAVTADDGATTGDVVFKSRREADVMVVSFEVKQVDISTIIVIE